MTGHDVLFLLAGLVTAGAALRAVTTPRPGHAVLWSALACAALGGCYLVLHSALIGVLQVLVYVGVVSLISVLTLVATGADRDAGPAPRVVTVVSGALLGLGLGALIAVATIAAAPSGAVAVNPPGASGVSADLFGTWAWPLGLLVLLGVVAGVTALVLSRAGAQQERR
ncbi:NADH-quinone oxidoreductase subunit J [Dermacoccaceae bacterium W4C1]